MNKTTVLSMLSGDTTVMYGLLADVPELVQLAEEVANNKADYDDLVELSYEFF